MDSTAEANVRVGASDGGGGGGGGGDMASSSAPRLWLAGSSTSWTGLFYFGVVGWDVFEDFTQYPGCGESYMKENPGAPLLLSWVVMGDAYPATESPHGTAPHLHGAPLRAGHDSHYTLVKEPSFDPVESVSERADADEIVIFNPEQVRENALNSSNHVLLNSLAHTHTHTHTHPLLFDGIVCSV